MQNEPLALDTALRHALDGSAVLFVGAGVSYLSKNKLNQPLPNGSALSHHLHEALGITNQRHQLDRIAGHFIRKLGAVRLFDFLQSQLKVVSLDEDLAEFYRINWRRVYTTNYDDAITVARKGHRSPQPFTLADAPDRVPTNATVHLNGFIERISPHKLSDDLTLTDVSYATSNFMTSPWAQFFRTDIRLCRSIIFVGYSLYDLDIAKILIEDTSLKNKTVFVIAPDADEVDIGALEAYGTVYPSGFEFLSSRLQEVMATYSPPNVLEAFYALQEIGITAPRGNLAYPVDADTR